MAIIEKALAVERLERDIFRGATIESQLPRTFGLGSETIGEEISVMLKIV